MKIQKRYQDNFMHINETGNEILNGNLIEQSGGKIVQSTYII